MNKTKILNLFIEAVESKYEALVQSALNAHDAATNEESKAENKYDTRGLEASYLAGAQAKRSEALKESLFHLKKIKEDSLIKSTSVQLLSLVSLVDDEGLEKFIFVLPTQGGLKVDYEDLSIQSITLESPIGKSIFKSSVGDEISLFTNKSKKYYEVNNIF